LNNISDSVTKATATPKKIKIADEAVLAESIQLTSKDIYHVYWHCYDFAPPVTTFCFSYRIYSTVFLCL